MSQSTPAPLRTWITQPLAPDVVRAVDRLRRADDVVQVALMPDVHLSHDVCVGTVAATCGLLYPAAVGGDIGCGMASVAVNADAALLDDEGSAAAILGDLYQWVPALRRRSREPLPEALVGALSDPALVKASTRDGAVQLGTLGRGNHFLEFQRDLDRRLWVLVHSGSRAMGQAITRHHLERARRVTAGLLALEAEGAGGAAYLNDLNWARSYAAANRLAMLGTVESLLLERFATSLDWSTLVHSDHNHAQREVHQGVPLWIHRKGAQSAREGERGIVPGSMGTATFHVVGRGLPESLTSCSHGAGRTLSREAARRRFRGRDLERDLRHVWFDVRRSASLCDEAPAAYRDIRQVMRAQRDLASVFRELHPVLNYKGN